ncbi:MarR family winged helix-turn-helix transcriptional regulator [Chloroflexota bacterium]
MEIQYINPDYALLALLYQARFAVARVRNDALRQFGITEVQSAILNIVQASDGPVIPSYIARQMFRDRHVVSEALDRMEKRGLVTKVKDLERKNLVRVSLTEKGEEICRRAMVVDVEAVSKTLSTLSQEERNNLKELLKAWRNKAIEEFHPKDRFPIYP